MNELRFKFASVLMKTVRFQLAAGIHSKSVLKKG